MVESYSYPPDSTGKEPVEKLKEVEKNETIKKIAVEQDRHN